MVRIYRRIHALLAKRVRESKRENSVAVGSDKKIKKKYVDAAKDLYAYTRIMDVCKGLSKNVESLKGIIDSLGETTYVTTDLTSRGKPN